MPVYTDLRCGRCKRSMIGGFRRSGGPGRSLLGVPFMMCWNCGARNKTGRLPWSAMTQTQRNWEVVKAILRALLNGFVAGVGLILIAELLGYHFAGTLGGVLMLVALFSGELISFGYHWWFYRRAIDKIERACSGHDWLTAPQVL